MENTNINNLPGEIWREIPEYKDYEISNYGRVISELKNTPRILAKNIICNRYRVRLYKRENLSKSESVGRLVASIFIREPKENEVLFYRDGNPLNDHVSNIGWKTKSESVRTARNRHRYSHKGESNGMAKLGNLQVKEIRILLEKGNPVKKISEDYGVSVDTVRRIKNGLTWKAA